MFFAKNTRRKPGAAKGNYAFRRRRKVVRLEVHRLELNPETAATRRESRRKTARLGFKLAVGLLAAMGIFSAGKIVVKEAFVDNSRFHLQHFSVVTDGEITPSQIVTATGLHEGMNMLGISLVQVKERLEAMPQVRSAKVTRGYPGMMFLDVEQRHPVAWLESPEQKLEAKVSGYGCLLDAEGVVIPSGELTESRRKLPVIRVGRVHRLVPGQKIESAPALAALTMLKMHDNTLASRTLGVKWVDATRAHVLGVTYDSRIHVTLPVDGMEKELARFDRVLAESERQKWQLATVDLLVAQNVPVTLRGTAIAPENLAPEPPSTPAKRTPAGRRTLARAQ
ncbi:FtsQ-type POTRA domain-containing protein [Verrucomicrobium sp. BvORR034]|jgi:cell division septal protein FtsQ|uniref:cell division protein FtsQ/DivIB n=1 Tax=Verrucomicrobium sp. BvORR034 TaxID=1396418 RepID=UPI000679CB7E|nr:FtsQ-type POTRA domain-containing protein [Verrucomicrobium sp. BvORR034]